MKRETNQRKNYFIKKDFQTKFILKFCGLIILAAIVSSALLFLYLSQRGTVTTAFVNSRLTIITTADYILPALIGTSLVAIFFITLATILTVLFISHRIAGPLFRIEKSMEEIASGRLNFKIQLRATDEIQAMAEGCNKMMDSLREPIHQIKKQAQEVYSTVDECAEILGKGTSLDEDQKNALRKLSSESGNLVSNLEHFKTD